MKTLGAVTAYLSCLAFSVGLFFRQQIASGFNVLFGDRADTRIENAILEHWYNVLSGHASWSKTFYFFPYKNTLAYNDGYFLYGLPYSLFRLLGVDPFLSSELVNVVLRVVAFAAFHLLLRRSFGLSQGWSLLGAVLFTISGTMEGQVILAHAQLLSVGFVPFFAWLAWNAAEAFAAGREQRFILWGCLASIFMAAWLMTAYYMAWFTLFFLSFYVLIAIIASPRATICYVLGLSRRGWLSVAAVAATFAVSILPFLRLYLPAAKLTGMHPFSEVQLFTVRPLDLINVGDGNLLLSRLDALLNSYFRPAFNPFGEHATGFTLLLLFVFLLACFSLWTGRWLPRSRVLWLLATTVVLTWLLTLQVGDWTLWAAVYKLVPGAKAARVVVRYQLFLEAPVIAVAVAYLARLGVKAPAAWPALALVALVLVAEQVKWPPPLWLDRQAELAELRSVPAPPAQCRSFFVSRARAGMIGNPETTALYSHNVDAMLLAERFRLPTINGHSTFDPPDWNFAGPERPDYLQRVRAYAQAHNLDNLCAVDLLAKHWDVNPFLHSGQS